MSITQNVALIKEVLSQTKNITFEKDKDLLHVNIRPLRNKIVVHKIGADEKEYFLKMVANRPEYANKASDKYYYAYHSYTLAMVTEKDALSLYEYLKTIQLRTEPEVSLEQENPYLNLLQKAQDTIKSHGGEYQQQSYPSPSGNQFDQNYNNYYPPNYFYGNPYYMMAQQYGYRGGANQNYYYNYNNYQNSMFIRKAQEDENESAVSNETSSRRGGGGDYYQKQYYGKPSYKSRGGYKSYNRDDYYESNKKHYNHVSKEEREQRTRINSENFPPLAGVDGEGPKQKSFEPEHRLSPIRQESRENKDTKDVKDSKDTKDTKESEQTNPEEAKDNKEKRIRYKRDDMILAYNNLNGVKINKSLLKYNEEDVPVLDKKAKAALELIDPSPKKTPEQSKGRKFSNIAI